MLAFGRSLPASEVSGFALGMRAATTLFNLALGSAATLVLLRTVSRRRRGHGLPGPAPRG